MVKRSRQKPSRLAQLRSVSLFADAPDEVLDQLAPHLEDVEVPAGRRLFTEGTPGHEAYVIVEGTAQVRVGGEVVGEAGPGELIGEVALLQHHHRTATMSALTPMRLLAVNAREINWLFSDAALSDRVREALERHLRGPQSDR